MTVKTEYEEIITEEGHSVVWRSRSFTLDAAHGSPESEAAVTDTSITGVLYPMSLEELQQGASEFKMGDMVMLTSSDNLVQVDDWVFDKDEDETGFTTIATTNATQFTVSGDQRSVFAVDDLISINDSGNTGLYVVTAVTFSTPNTVLTVADPSTGDSVWLAARWKVLKVQDWPGNADKQVRHCVLRKRDTSSRV
jgi:hypothetical protein